MEIVIIIPTYNRLSYLKDLLNDLNSQSNKEFAVLIVDASESNETKLFSSNIFSVDVHYLSIDNNVFWTGAINRGIIYVKTHLDWVSGIILLNDDIRISKDFVENIYLLKSRNIKSLIGCVNINITDKSTVVWAGMVTNKWFAITSYLFKSQNINLIDNNLILNSFTLIGRGLYIPMAAFDEVGSFDEKHLPHRGDTEFPLRAKKRGYKLFISFMPKIYTYSDLTYDYDNGKLKLGDFKKVFFDFRSSSNIKTRFYYAKSATNGWIQFSVFFTIEMLIHLRRFLIRLKKTHSRVC